MFLLKTLRYARGSAINTEIREDRETLKSNKLIDIVEIVDFMNKAFAVMPIAMIITKKNQSLKSNSVLNLISTNMSKTAKVIAKIIEIKLVVGFTSDGGLIPKGMLSLFVA